MVSLFGRAQWHEEARKTRSDALRVKQEDVVGYFYNESV
jgi:hypothetical protein